MLWNGSMNLILRGIVQQNVLAMYFCCCECLHTTRAFYWVICDWAAVIFKQFPMSDNWMLTSWNHANLNNRAFGRKNLAIFKQPTPAPVLTRRRTPAVSRNWNLPWAWTSCSSAYPRSPCGNEPDDNLCEWQQQERRRKDRSQAGAASLVKSEVHHSVDTLM